MISFVNGESVNFNEVVQSFWNKDFWVFDFGARSAGCNSPLQRWSIITKKPLHIILIDHKVFSTSILVKFLPQVGMRAYCIRAFVFAWFMVQIKSLTVALFFYSMPELFSGTLVPGLLSQRSQLLQTFSNMPYGLNLVWKLDWNKWLSLFPVHFRPNFR